MKDCPLAEDTSYGKEKKSWWQDLNSLSTKRTLRCARWCSPRNLRALPVVGFETGVVSLEFVSSEGIRCDMSKSLLSESTVFTYLPVFKIFVKSYEKTSNDQIWAHSVYCPQCQFWAKICGTFSNILSFLILLSNPLWCSEDSSSLRRNYYL